MDHWLGVQEALSLGLVTFCGLPRSARWVMAQWARAKPLRIGVLLREHAHLRETYARRYHEAKAFAASLEDEDACRAAKMQVAATLDALDRHLEGRHFICGDDFTLADAAWAAVLWRLRKLGTGAVQPEGLRPRLAAYAEALFVRPSVVKGVVRPSAPRANLPLIPKALPGLAFPLVPMLAGAYSGSAIFSTILPKFSPVKRRRMASGAFSMPSRMSSRCLSRPLLSHSARRG
jgi:hypothetical protein